MDNPGALQPSSLNEFGFNSSLFAARIAPKKG
jgi:hypothetical protein